MKKTRILAAVLVIMLIAVSAISMLSCEKADANTLGKGATAFTLIIINDKEESKTYTIKTDEKTVGDALVKVELTPKAEYVETLDGVTATWVGDGTGGYWAFYIDGIMAEVGAFQADVKKDAIYKFEYTKETAFNDDVFEDSDDHEGHDHD